MNDWRSGLDCLRCIIPFGHQEEGIERTLEFWDGKGYLG